MLSSVFEARRLPKDGASAKGEVDTDSGKVGGWGPRTRRVRRVRGPPGAWEEEWAEAEWPSESLHDEERCMRHGDLVARFIEGWAGEDAERELEGRRGIAGRGPPAALEYTWCDILMGWADRVTIIKKRLGHA